MSENFANTYFDLDDCRKIGYIREDIERKYKSNIINSDTHKARCSWFDGNKKCMEFFVLESLEKFE